MREIIITHGKTVLLDDADFELVNEYKYRWHAENGHGTYYACTSSNHRHLLMHRLILGLTDSKIIVVHKDGNGCNNQRDNLRIATESQNGANRTIRQKNNTSGFKGVCWAKTKKKWKSAIQFQKKVLHIGYYLNKEEAAHAYDKKALELFGEFARLNFPISL